MAAFNMVGLAPERLAPWVNLGLVAALAVSLAHLSWEMIPAPALEAPPAMAAGMPSRVPARSDGLERVARLHLFGSARQPVTTKAAPVEAPDTRLNLTLRGVFAADQPTGGGAIIAEGSREERFYRVGDRLSGGATLSEIYPDRVILERAGRYETLRLPEESLTGVALTDARASRAPDPGVRSELPELAGYREEIRQNPAKALELVQLQPVMEGGRVKGYRVGPGRDRELFRRSGLRAGDVVTSVNGMALDDPNQMNEVFSQLTSAGELALTVERGGGVHTVTVGIQ